MRIFTKASLSIMGFALIVSTVPLHSSSAQDVVAIDGSSTVYPISEIMAEEFQAEYPDTRITIGVSGTGGGFKKFCRGDTVISNASRPIKVKEIENCAANGIEFIELPVALDALSVVVNPNNDWVDEMTVAELKTMWEDKAQGVINNWKQVNSSYPDRALTLFGAGVDSGTYDYFTAAINGQEHVSRGDYTASEDDNVLVLGVEGDVNALGFFGLAYYVENQNRLKAVAIKLDENSQAVLPSVENARSGVYQPLSRPIFIYVNKKAADENQTVSDFVDFYLDYNRSAELVDEVGYVSLPEHAYKAFSERFQSRTTGSAFVDGSMTGVSIDYLIEAPLR